jgi:hypothetical protein
MENSKWAQGAISILSFYVDEEKRGQGLGKRLIKMVIDAYPNEEISAQVSSLASLKAFMNMGFKPSENPAASFEEAKEIYDYNGDSVNVRFNGSPEKADNPLGRLKGHLINLYALYEAEDYDKLMEIMESPVELQKMMQMIGDADEHLTGKRLPEDQYKNSAEVVLQAENEVVHLADGGYSRLIVSYSQPPHLWIDEGASSPKVVERFKAFLLLQ